MIEIPSERLPSATLNAVIEEYILREAGYEANRRVGYTALYDSNVEYI